MIKTTIIQTPLGEMVAGATEDGICLLEFIDRLNVQTGFKDLATLLNTTIEVGENRHLKLLRKELNEYYNGKLKVFSVELVTPGSGFQQSVWKELLNIPFGSTRSYKEQAKALKKPGAIRAVANANRKNRISVIIPCHRVIGTDGSLTGYGGGLTRKKWLLDHESRYSGKTTEMELF